LQILEISKSSALSLVPDNLNDRIECSGSGERDFKWISNNSFDGEHCIALMVRSFNVLGAHDHGIGLGAAGMSRKRVSRVSILEKSEGSEVRTSLMTVLFPDICRRLSAQGAPRTEKEPGLSVNVAFPLNLNTKVDNVAISEILASFACDTGAVIDNVNVSRALREAKSPIASNVEGPLI
jgi:hypothetical protein